MVKQPAGLNCTTSPWALKPNSDISGIGILIGFAATSYLTLILCVAYYLVDFKRLSNPVDRYCIDEFYRLSHRSRPSERWAKALEGAVLSFSDQQVITGIAILISGYSQLRGGLAVYYWQLTVDLAWFSSVTHLTTLTCLRSYFRERQGLKILRLVCMVVTAGMLSSALASTGYLGDTSFTYDYPAWCLFHPNLLGKAIDQDNFKGNYKPYYNSSYVAFVLIFLLVSYCARIIQLFPSGLDKRRKNGHARLSTFAQARLRNYKNRALGNLFGYYWASVYTLTMAICCIFKAAADLYSSMLWEITWLATALAWGSIRIVMDRDVNYDFQTSDPGSEYSSQDVISAVIQDNEWGFGQVVAVALLATPLFFFFESIYESVIMDRTNCGRLPSSASTQTDPIESSGSSSAEPWTNLYKSSWFPSLVWLIYIQSLATAANVLYVFPFEGDSYELNDDIGSAFGYYFAWFGVDLAMLFIFTITSLLLSNVQDTLEFGWVWGAKMLAKQTEQIQILLLILSVLILSAASATFGWKTFFSSTFFNDQ